MSLIEKIQSDILSSIKSGNPKKRDTLRFIVSQLKYMEIELKRQPSDDEVVTKIRKQIKELQEAKDQFVAGGRPDLALDNDEQVGILSVYLPAEISEEELEKMVLGFIESNRAEYNSNPKALTGKVIAVLKKYATPSRIASVYSRISN
jgi:uncharacterized protein